MYRAINLVTWARLNLVTVAAYCRSRPFIVRFCFQYS
jgi:hypothetical protein